MLFLWYSANNILILSIGEDAGIRDVDVISAALYPKVFNDYMVFKEEYGPVEGLPTRLFFTGPELGEEFQVEIEVKINTVEVLNAYVYQMVL